MGIQFGGFDEFGEYLDRIAKAGAAKRDRFVAQEAEVIIGHAKDNTPTDTGVLKNGWRRTRSVQETVTVYNNTEYAAHVEYGHRQTPGRFVPTIGKRLIKWNRRLTKYERRHQKRSKRSIGRSI
jgi:hypothetical protein